MGGDDGVWGWVFDELYVGLRGLFWVFGLCCGGAVLVLLWPQWPQRLWPPSENVILPPQFGHVFMTAPYALFKQYVPYRSGLFNFILYYFFRGGYF